MKHYLRYKLINSGKENALEPHQVSKFTRATLSPGVVWETRTFPT